MNFNLVTIPLASLSMAANSKDASEASPLFAAILDAEQVAGRSCRSLEHSRCSPALRHRDGTCSRFVPNGYDVALGFEIEGKNLRNFEIFGLSLLLSIANARNRRRASNEPEDFIRRVNPFGELAQF